MIHAEIDPVAAMEKIMTDHPDVHYRVAYGLTREQSALFTRVAVQGYKTQHSLRVVVACLSEADRVIWDQIARQFHDALTAINAAKGGA